MESHCGDRLVIETLVGWRRALILQVLVYHVIKLFVVASSDTSNCDIRKMVVVHVTVFVIGDIWVISCTAWMVVHGVRHNTLGSVAVVVAEDENGGERDVPVVISVFDVVVYSITCVSATLINSHDIGQDSLLVAEKFYRVGEMEEVRVVWHDDEILASCCTTLNRFLDKVLIIKVWNHILVDNHVSDNLFPCLAEITRVAAEVSVAAFKTHFEIKFSCHNEFLADWIVLERGDAENHDIDVTDFHRF